jgi:hypothetical protein
VPLDSFLCIIPIDFAVMVLFQTNRLSDHLEQLSAASDLEY